MHFNTLSIPATCDQRWCLGSAAASSQKEPRDHGSAGWAAEAGPAARLSALCLLRATQLSTEPGRWRPGSWSSSARCVRKRAGLPWSRLGRTSVCPVDRWAAFRCRPTAWPSPLQRNWDPTSARESHRILVWPRPLPKRTTTFSLAVLKILSRCKLLRAPGSVAWTSSLPLGTNTSFLPTQQESKWSGLDQPEIRPTHALTSFCEKVNASTREQPCEPSPRAKLPSNLVGIIRFDIFFGGRLGMECIIHNRRKYDNPTPPARRAKMIIYILIIIHVIGIASIHSNMNLLNWYTTQSYWLMHAQTFSIRSYLYSLAVSS